MALLATRDLVEAAALAGALEGMEPLVARYERWAQQEPRIWTQVIAHRCRALITQGPAAEPHDQAALAVDGIAAPPLELAHSELAYGRWLRQERRHTEARAHLGAILEAYARLGTAAWADRARAELQASDDTTLG